MGKNNFEQVYKLIPNNIGCLKICDRQCEKETVFLLPKEIEYISKKTKIPKNKIAEKHKINNHEIWIIKREREIVYFIKNVNVPIETLDH